MGRIEAVVFDLDDTLYPEREYVSSGFRAVAERYADRLGDPLAAAAAMSRIFDTADSSRVFQQLLVERGIDDDALARAMVETYRTHPPTIRLFDDAEAALRSLLGTVRLGVLTDGRSTTQRAKVSALGLYDRADEILVSSELGPGIAKPDPRPFMFMSARLQVCGDRTVYIGDNPTKDFVAPNALGWRSIQVRRAGGLYADRVAPPSGQAHRIVENLASLVEMLSLRGGKLR